MKFLRVTQHPIYPCAPQLRHGCTDPDHPLRVDLLPIPADGVPTAIPITPGTASVSVALVDTDERPGTYESKA